MRLNVDKDIWSDLLLALKVENEESQLYTGDPGRWAELIEKARKDVKSE